MPIRRLEFRRSALRTAVRAASQRALKRTGDYAYEWWQQIAPVSQDPRTSGGLLLSWFAFVREGERRVVLIFGASAPYAIYVELGTTKMAPRAPVRATAGEATAMLPYLVRRELYAALGH